MVNVSKLLQKNFCSQALPVCIYVNWKVLKNQLKMGIWYMYQCNGNGKMTEAPMMVFCSLPEPRKDILFRIYSLFIFLAADKNFYLWYSPSSSNGRQRRRGSVMSEPYYVIIIGPYYYNSHITPAPPPATSCHCWHGPVLTHTPGQPHRRLLHVIGMWCATKMVAYLLW